jgi:hypothetical protein
LGEVGRIAKIFERSRIQRTTRGVSDLTRAF